MRVVWNLINRGEIESGFFRGDRLSPRRRVMLEVGKATSSVQISLDAVSQALPGYAIEFELWLTECP